MADAMGHIGVIFDCDGTLLDSMDAWREVEAALAERAGAQLTARDADELGPLTIPEAGVFFHERFGLGGSPEEVVGMIDELMLAFYRERSHERPGALAFVQGLHAAGVRLSVASSSPQEYLQAGLAHTGFLPYLDAVLSVNDVNSSKREPVVYDRARELMGTPLETTWGFEDSLFALKTLCAAGYRTVGIYDNDIAGTLADLTATADLAITSFQNLPVNHFLKLANERRAC